MKTANLRSVSLAEIIDLAAHPVAALFPMLKDAVRKEDGKKLDTLTLPELADSIYEYGLQEAIVLFTMNSGETVVLDGRNRRAACQKVVEAVDDETIETFMVEVEDFIGTEEEADEYVLSLNIDRRDLDPSQRADIAADYWDLEAERAKIRQEATQLAGKDSEGHWIGGGSDATTEEKGKTRDVLGKRFRVSARLIQVARNRKRDLEVADAAVESSRLEVQRQRDKEEAAKVELEAAKVAQDELRAKEAAIRANQAAQAAAAEREKLAAKSEEATKKRSDLAKIKAGEKTFGELQKESAGLDTGVDDPVGKAKARLNKIVTDLINEFDENARILVNQGGPADRENVRQKMIKLDGFMERISKAFGAELDLIDDVDNLLDTEENNNYWADSEMAASDAGEKRLASKPMVVKMTKDCGCDFTGRMHCPICTPGR